MTPQPTIDALTTLSVPSVSPTLEVLRELTPGDEKTAKGEKFTLTHTPMAAPPLPDAAKRVKRQKRAHVAHTLMDTLALMTALKVTDKGLCFYDDEGIDVILDSQGEDESEIVSCQLRRHSIFDTWSRQFNTPMGVREFVSWLRLHTDQVKDVDTIIGEYASARGELIHDVDEYLDEKAASVSFTVKRKGKGAQAASETEVTVATAMTVNLPVLLDDTSKVPFHVLLNLENGGPDGIIVTMQPVAFDSRVQEHIEQRLASFQSDAEFPCIRGRCNFHSWEEPSLPACIEELMDKQTEMIAAMAK